MLGLPTPILNGSVLDNYVAHDYHPRVYHFHFCHVSHTRYLQEEGHSSENLFEIEAFESTFSQIHV